MDKGYAKIKFHINLTSGKSEIYEFKTGLV